MIRVAAKGLYASNRISVVIGTKNSDYRFRDITSDAVKQFENIHKTALLISPEMILSKQLTFNC